MPLFPNLTDLKGLANSFNPLSAFSTSDSPSPSPTPAPNATPGPGPSTAAQQARSAAPLPPTAGDISCSSDSISTEGADDAAGVETRRETAGLVVAEQEGARRPGARRRERPVSMASEMTGVSMGTEAGGVPGPSGRRRKNPLDTYVIVKPPPTSSKNPLNLQIQLVVKPSLSARRSRSASGMSERSASPPISLPSSSPTKPPSDAIPSPQKRSESPKEGSEGEGDTAGGGLKRSNSRKSQASTVASAGTLASSSTLSGGTGGAGRRKRVEPMFNLAVHNVMQPTVVTDAATDVKVAKFLKRNLDITGVGILEPSEVWLPPSAQASTLNLPPTAHHGRLSDDLPARSRPHSVIAYTHPLSPTASTVSTEAAPKRASFDVSGRKSLDLKSLRMDGLLAAKDGHEGGATKRFFGKVFKRKGAEEPHGETEAIAGVPGGMRGARGVSPARTPEPGSPNLAATTAHVVVKVPSGEGFGHPTFGTSPLVVHRRSSGTIVTPDGAVTGLTAPNSGLGLGLPASSLDAADESTTTLTLPMLPSSRPVGYTWTVKKWAKRNAEGWAAHLVAAASAGIEMVGSGLGGDEHGSGEGEVVFEWVKLKVPSNSVGSSIMRRYSTAGTLGSRGTSVGGQSERKRRGTSAAGGRRATVASTTNNTTSEANLAAPLPPSTSASPMPSPSPSLDPRPDPVRRVSASAVSFSSAAKSSIVDIGDYPETDNTADEGGTESDPEDSETPWTCSIWVKKTGQRQLLGTLTPAVHHPKVIGVLRIPRNLQPVSLVHATSTPAAAAAKGGGGGMGLLRRVKEEVALSEENLKDVVCVTAMWVVAREEFGGIGRKKRG